MARVKTAQILYKNGNIGIYLSVLEENFQITMTACENAIETIPNNIRDNRYAMVECAFI